jgi:cytoskeletal protein CcmA (bactofilin family)
VFKKRKEPSLEVIIGSESAIKGSLSTKGVVRLDGMIDGNVEADWLIVGERGVVKGDVVTRGTVVDGRVEGSITSDEILEIKSRGTVEGDVFTSKLIVSEGALFDGRSCMRKFAESENKDILQLEQKMK